MRHLTRPAVAALIGMSVLSLVGLADPAGAKGGTPTPPAPTPVTLECFSAPTNPHPDDATVGVNYAGEAGCVGVRYINGGLRLDWVAVAPGWTYVVKSNGTGTNSRVQLQFTQSSTGKKVDFRYEFGKTVIG